MRHRHAIVTQPLALGALAVLLASAGPLSARQVNVNPNAIRQQLSTAGNGAASAPAQAPAKPSAAAPAPKPAAKPAAAPAAQKAPQKGTPKPAQVSAKKPDSTVTASAAPAGAARRDPFEPLIGREKGGPIAETALPPGKSGLQITTLRLDGIVRGPNGMIAVVSNPQQRVYFLRDGDRLYDGEVEHITMEAVAFHQTGTDPFGKAVERQVSKQLYSTSGELK